MDFSNKKLIIIASVVTILLAVFVGLTAYSPDAQFMEQIDKRAVEECQKHGIELSIGHKHLSGFAIKTLVLYNVVAKFKPFCLAFSSIAATPSITAIADNAIDGKLTAYNVSLQLPFLGTINFGDGSAHVHVDNENNIFVRDFKFHGACNVNGYFTITKDNVFTDYRFVFTPSKGQQTLFATLASLGTSFKRLGNDQWLLEGKSK